VVGDRPDQQRGRRRGKGHAGHVEVPLRGAELDEPGGERQRKQEPEQHLHAKAGHAQLLDQLTEVAVVPLRRGLLPRIRDLAGLHIDHLLVH
jgi:hypothetical protein